jgi:hypothetical protein
MAIRRSEKLVELALGAGFLAVALAILVARRSPATGYEVSIYSATPLLTWVLLAGALLVATAVIVRRSSETATTFAAVLGGTAITTVVSLPLVRGYYYLGAADSLTHLGWVRDISDGVIGAHSLLYPGYHSVSLATARLTGSTPEQALLVVTVLLFLAFLVFVPLTVKLTTGSTRAMGFAAVCSWFILPINNIATHLIPHTNSLALFYVPVVLFTLLLFLRSGRSGPPRLERRLAGVSLAVVSVGLILLHIQHAVNVLLLFVGVCVTQFVARRIAPNSSVAEHRSLYFQTALFGLMAAVWTLSHEIIVREVVLTIRGLSVGSVGTTATVAQRGSSLTTIGGSLIELFVKMFVVSALIGFLTAVYLLVAAGSSNRLSRETGTLSLYFTVALLPLSGLFVLYFVGTPKMSFRQLGFVYVLLTILGAIAITRGTDWLGRSIPAGRTVATTVLVVCLVLSLLTVFGSPYIYIASPGVTEQDMSSYQTTLETRTDEVPLATLSTQPYRHIDAVSGTERTSQREYEGAGNGTLSPPAFNDGEVTQAYPGDTFHVLLTKRDVMRQIEVYDQINYRESGLTALERDRRVNRVFSNGESEVYLVSTE